MKRSLMFLTVLLIAAGPFLADAETIYDTGDNAYWGGTETYSWNKDVIGDKFAVDTMQVTHTGDSWSVKLTGIYFSRFLSGDTEVKDYGPGDLYISSQGWKTVSSDGPHFITDTFTQSEGWDYVVNSSGVHALNNWNGIQWTDAPYPGYVWRRDQAWKGGYTGVPIHNATVDIAGSSMTFNFSTEDIDLGDSIGLHWNMKCGNDVVEGGVGVPEPSSGLLLLFGAAALLIATGIRGRMAFLNERIR